MVPLCATSYILLVAEVTSTPAHSLKIRMSLLRSRKTWSSSFLAQRYINSQVEVTFHSPPCQDSQRQKSYFRANETVAVMHVKNLLG